MTTGEPPMMIQTIEHCAKCGCDYTVITALDEVAMTRSSDPRKFADIEHAASIKAFADDHENHR